MAFELFTDFFKISCHFADSFMVKEINCFELNSELIFDVAYKAHCIERTHSEISFKIVFTLDFVNFNVVFKDFNK